MVLHKIGIGPKMIYWIKACIKGASFAILINDFPTSFFQSLKGLCQGCALPPSCSSSSFSLSKKISKAHERNLLCVCKIFERVPLSHLIYVDGKSDPSEWAVFHNILEDFGSTSRLFMNQKKPLLISNDPEA